jgi:hypothetical protein
MSVLKLFNLMVNKFSWQTNHIVNSTEMIIGHNDDTKTCYLNDW